MVVGAGARQGLLL